MKPLTIAIPKGRILKELGATLEAVREAGVALIDG